VAFGGGEQPAGGDQGKRIGASYRDRTLVQLSRLTVDQLARFPHARAGVVGGILDQENDLAPEA